MAPPSKKHTGEDVRQFIIEHIRLHPNDIASFTARYFNITKQAVNLHLQKLIEEGYLVAYGTTRKKYESGPVKKRKRQYKINEKLAEFIIWEHDFYELFRDLTANVQEISHYGFTEIVNNVIDHSGGKNLTVIVEIDLDKVTIVVKDDGVGIFKKIAKEYNLPDERLALLELAKGKVTTDPENHTGEGIFFTSRAFDKFYIQSGDLLFSHDVSVEDDWLYKKEENVKGTEVFMQITKNNNRTLKELFDEFADEKNDYAFDKTVVPVKLIQHEGENLVSRSQAKRLVARFEKFKVVVLDFKGIKMIGQAFSDEVFRVFKNKHPEVKLCYENAEPFVERMIKRALNYDRDI